MKKIIFNFQKYCMCIYIINTLEQKLICIVSVVPLMQMLVFDQFLKTKCFYYGFKIIQMWLKDYYLYSKIII